MFSSVATILSFLSFVSAIPVYGPTSRVSYNPGNDWYASPSGKGAQQSSGYQCFHGEISSYPTINEWVSFDNMWQINRDLILSFNSLEQARDIYYSIKTISTQANVDPRLTLAVVMQESSGNPQVPCTGNGNCGLMQANKGSVSYSSADASGSIQQMIEDGVLGTSGGPGLVQLITNDPSLAYTGNRWGLNPYAALRCYNSGSISASGDLDDAQYGVKSYVNDVANRLLGWNGYDGRAAQAQCELSP